MRQLIMPYQDRTSIAVPRDTKKRLRKRKRADDTWDEFLSKVAAHGIQGGDRE